MVFFIMQLLNDVVIIMNDKLALWREKKKELGMTNKQIAELAKLPLRTVEQVMCGTVASPRLDTVQAIEHALGLDEEPKSSVQVPDKYKDIMVALNDGDKNLQQEDIDAIVRFIEFTKNK